MVRNKKIDLGKAFSDSFEKQLALFKKNKSTDGHVIGDFNDAILGGRQTFVGLSSWQVAVFYSAIVFLAGLAVIRLFSLQIVSGPENRIASDQNRISYRTIHASRGVIYDRSGKILARNAPGFRLTKGDKTTFLESNTALDLLNKGLAFEDKEGELGKLEIDSIRDYPYGAAGAHALGYTSEISQTEISSDNFKKANYKLGDRIGRIGVESQYQSRLRGSDGQRLVEVDATGTLIRVLGDKQPTPGTSLRLSLDADLNKRIYDALSAQIQKIGAKAGAAVAEDPRTGQILALTSYPAFDPNIFSRGADEAAIGKVITDDTHPLFDRAVAGTYPPGSVFKLATTYAALSSGKIKPDTTFVDTGQIFLGTFQFANWYFTEYGRTEGEVDLTRAIKRSNDTYFYHVGQVVGEQAIATYAKKLGLGERTGIDLPGEETGLIPDDAWKRANIGEPWFPGDTLHMAIGQGFVLTTPIQIANLTATVAGGGMLLRPHLLQAEVDEGGKVIKKYDDQKIAGNIIPPDQIAVIKEGMREACAQGGTGWPFFDFKKTTVGCKTGTAEFGEKPHAWFTIFAPFDNPQIVLTIIIENGGEGSSVSGPVARQIFDWWFAAKGQ